MDPAVPAGLVIALVARRGRPATKEAQECNREAITVHLPGAKARSTVHSFKSEKPIDNTYHRAPLALLLLVVSLADQRTVQMITNYRIAGQT